MIVSSRWSGDVTKASGEYHEKLHNNIKGGFAAGRFEITWQPKATLHSYLTIYSASNPLFPPSQEFRRGAKAWVDFLCRLSPGTEAVLCSIGLENINVNLQSWKDIWVEYTLHKNVGYDSF